MTQPLFVCTLQRALDLQPSALPAQCKTSGSLLVACFVNMLLVFERVACTFRADVDSTQSKFYRLVFMLKNTTNPNAGSCEGH